MNREAMWKFSNQVRADVRSTDRVHVDQTAGVVRDPDTGPRELSDEELGAVIRGGAIELTKLYPTLAAAELAVGQVQAEFEGGPYQPGGKPPRYFELTR